MKIVKTIMAGRGTYSLMWDSNQGGSPHRNIVDFDIGEMKNDAEIG